MQDNDMQFAPKPKHKVLFTGCIPVTEPVKTMNCLALGYFDEQQRFVATDVLCNNFPPLTDAQKADLSFKLSNWSKTQFAATA